MTTVTAAMLTRIQIEDFIYREAALLDEWKLDDWLAMYTADCRYEIGPTGKPDAARLSPETSLFLVADNRFRLEQRVIRLKKPTAHAEYPHSRSRQGCGQFCDVPVGQAQRSDIFRPNRLHVSDERRRR
jgi:p-cumate 2,3-dioxygenase beta subunit